MLWTPQKGKLLRQTNLGGVGANPLGTTVTTGASASTKGTPVQLLASTDFEVFAIRITAWGIASSAVSSALAIDILAGASTEEIIIPNLLGGFCGLLAGSKCGRYWHFPLHIPAGTRLAAQAASERTSTTFQIGIELMGGSATPPWRVADKVTTYGMGAVPDGTAITPGASGAEGSWTQITSGTSEDHFAVIPSFQLSATTGAAARVLSVDVGFGAATEVEMGGPGLFIYDCDSTEAMGCREAYPVYQDMPAGTRLSMRASNSATNTGMTFNGALHCLS